MGNKKEELTQLSNLISLIYEGTTDPGYWSTSILTALAEYIQSPVCMLFRIPQTSQNGSCFFSHGITLDHIDLYLSKYIHMDVWLHAIAEKKLFYNGSISIGEELVPRKQLRQSTIYKEYLSRDKNMAQLLSCVIFGADSTSPIPMLSNLKITEGFYNDSIVSTTVNFGKAGQATLVGVPSVDVDSTDLIFASTAFTSYSVTSAACSEWCCSIDKGITIACKPGLASNTEKLTESVILS